MYADFFSVFKNPQLRAKTPKAILETINKNLPKGFHYIDAGNGICKMDCDRIISISPVRPVLSEETKQLFPDREVTMSDLMCYAYNSQTRIQLLPDDDGCFTLNGQRISVNSLVVNTIQDIVFSEGECYLIPPPFPDPIQMEITGGGYSLNLLMQQQPIHSLTCIRMASVGNGALTVSYTVDYSKTENNMQFSISTNNSPSVAETLASKVIFNAFIKGDGRLCGVPIKSNTCITQKLIPEESLQFWLRLTELEKIMHANFDASKAITTEDYYLINSLHSSLIGKQPFKIYKTDMTLQGSGKYSKSFLEAPNKCIDKEIMVEYIKTTMLELLGDTHTVYSLVNVFGGIVSEIIPPNNISNEAFIRLTAQRPNSMYASEQYYLSEDEAISAREDKTHITHFKMAHDLKDY